MDDRLGTRAIQDIADRARRPYDLILKLKGRKSEAYWGRWADPSRAHQEGHDLMRETRKSQLPFSRKCIGYKVTDTRNGEPVTDPALLAQIHEAIT